MVCNDIHDCEFTLPDAQGQANLCHFNADEYRLLAMLQVAGTEPRLLYESVGVSSWHCLSNVNHKDRTGTTLVQLL